jgi:hypothetical protein
MPPLDAFLSQVVNRTRYVLEIEKRDERRRDEE